MNKQVVGFTNGSFDLFHIGHLNLLNRCKEFCDYLVVGVNSDRAVKMNDKTNVIQEQDRLEIIKNVKSVDEAFLIDDHNLMEVFKSIHFDVLIIGDDWKDTDRWLDYERIFKPLGVKFIYLPRTENISTTKIKNILK